MKVRYTLTVIAEREINPEDYIDEDDEDAIIPTITEIQAIELENYRDDPYEVFASLINVEGMKEELKMEQLPE